MAPTDSGLFMAVSSSIILSVSILVLHSFTSSLDVYAHIISDQIIPDMGVSNVSVVIINDYNNTYLTKYIIHFH